jgi:hypothetical protein
MAARLSDQPPVKLRYDNAIESLDGRTLAARRLKKTRVDLIKHLGHEPNPYEESLIDRVAVLTSRVIELEARALRGVDSPEDSPNLMILISNLHQLLSNLGWQSNPVIQNSHANFPLDAA